LLVFKLTIEAYDLRND